MSDWIREYFRIVDGMDLEGYLALHTDDVHFRFGNAPTTTGKEPIRDGLAQPPVSWRSLMPTAVISGIERFRGRLVTAADTDDDEWKAGLAQAQRNDPVQTGPEAGCDGEGIPVWRGASVHAALHGCHEALKALRTRRTLEPDTHLAGGAGLEQQRVMTWRLQAELTVRQAASVESCSSTTARRSGSREPPRR